MPDTARLFGSGCCAWSVLCVELYCLDDLISCLRFVSEARYCVWEVSYVSWYEKIVSKHTYSAMLFDVFLLPINSSGGVVAITSV
jgi:hypothetical protein